MSKRHRREKKPGSAGHAPGASPEVQKETERYLRHLQAIVKRQSQTQSKLEERLGWRSGATTDFFAGRRTIKLWQLLTLLEAVEVEPPTYFAGLYPESPIRRGLGPPLAERYENAPDVLGNPPNLEPDTPGFLRLYIERSLRTRSFIGRARGTRLASRAFHGLVAGHRGAGTSTELRRLLKTSDLEATHRVAVLDLPRAIGALELLWSLAATCASLLSEEPSPALRAKLDAWGIRRETADPDRINQDLEHGDGPLSTDSRNVPPLPELIDELAAVVLERFSVRPLIVLEGLSRWDLEPLGTLLDTSLRTIERPGLSTVLVLPLSILYQPLEALLGHPATIIPPVSTFDGIEVPDRVARSGQDFFDDLIRRYLPLDELTDDARASLALLSAGLPGEMIARTRDACRAAAAAGAEKVDKAAVETVWREQETQWRERLSADDLTRLRHIANDPFDDGAEGLAELLHENAVLLQPEHGGWLAVHPVVRRLLEETR